MEPCSKNLIHHNHIMLPRDPLSSPVRHHPHQYVPKEPFLLNTQLESGTRKTEPQPGAQTHGRSSCVVSKKPVQVTPACIKLTA